MDCIFFNGDVCLYVCVCMYTLYVCVCLFVWLVVCLLTLACFLVTFNCTPWRWHCGYIEFLGKFHQDHTSNALLMAKGVALVAHPGDRCSPTGRLAGVIYFSILQALNWPWPDRWAAIECFKKTRWFSGKLQAVTPDRRIRSMRFQHCNRGWMGPVYLVRFNGARCQWVRSTISMIGMSL